MTTLPSHTLILCDTGGAPFGALRLSPSEDAPHKGDCIFDITPGTPEQAALPEVRWLHKHRYKRRGEHRFNVNDEGVITVTQASFKMVLDPDEHGELLTRGPMPSVTGFWEPDDG